MSRRLLVSAVASAALFVSAAAVPATAAPSANPPSARAVAKWNLDQGDLNQIAKAKTWSEKQRAVNSRICRSGSNFRLTTAVGSGAYLQSDKRWGKYGGARFADAAAEAPGFAQKLIAWRLFKDTGWKNLSCPTGNWMEVAFTKAKNTTLSEMLIPGTHDSGASLIKDTPPCRPEVIVGVSPFYKIAAERNPCVAAALARAQDQNLGGQLKGGVRYLDMRVGIPADKVITDPAQGPKDPLKVPFVFEHGFVSQPLSKGVGQVLDFAASHPKEQVILDFQHVTLTGVPAVDAYYEKQLVGFLKKFRPDAAAPTVCEASWTKKAVDVKDSEVATSVPIRRAWKLDRNLIVLMEDGLPADNCYRPRDKVISSPWPATQDPKVSKNDNDAYLAERQDRLESGPCVDADDGVNWCGMFVNQVQLSASAETQANCVLNDTGEYCSLRDLADLVNDKVAGYMRTWTNDGLPTNIEIVDFYEDADPSIVDRLIRLNWKRTGQFPR